VWMDKSMKSFFCIKKGVRQSSHQFYLTCSLMTFLIDVINMESLLVINVVLCCGGLFFFFFFFFFADDIVLCFMFSNKTSSYEVVKV